MEFTSQKKEECELIFTAQTSIKVEDLRMLINKEINLALEKVLDEKLSKDYRHINDVPLNRSAAAKEANVSPETISNWDKKGWIVGQRIAGRKYYYMSDIFSLKSGRGAYWSKDNKTNLKAA